MIQENSSFKKKKKEKKTEASLGSLVLLTHFLPKKNEKQKWSQGSYRCLGNFF